jgi:predicted RNA-binding Zn-ribbon protein involved in translation (DUF1610 family)
MNMNPSAAIKSVAFPAAKFSINWPSLFVFSAGTILTVTGVSNIIGGFSETQMLDVPDPIGGLPFRYLMLALGTAELVVAFLCLFTDKRALSLGLIVWLAANLLCYRIGLWKMGWQHSSGFLIVPLGLSLKGTDYLFSSFSILLLMGGITMLWFNRRMALAAGFLKMSCPSCGVHIKFAVQNLGQKIPCPQCQKETILRKSDFLKMSCFFCREHIEFPAHAFGQKIKCPHCKSDITLMEPT